MLTHELERESALVLPEREALSHFNVALFAVYSQASAANVFTILSAATAVSGNVVTVNQWA
jgi:hypothetical protein